MAFRRTDTTENDVFMLTLSLLPNGLQYSLLEKLFRAGLMIEHQLMALEVKKLRQLERTREWHNIQAEIVVIYKDAELSDTQRKQMLKPLFSRKSALLRDCGLNEYAFMKDAKHINVYGNIVHSQTVQKIASRVWAAFEDYLFGKGNDPRFTSWKDFTCLQGKQNTTGIRFCHADNSLIVGKQHIPVKLSKRDPYGYEAECLRRSIHFCGIIRRWYPSGWRYFAQLCLGEKPPIKAKPDTGELLHPIGSGRVGLDIGPQTLAAVGDRDTILFVLAENVESIHRELRRLQRKRDRTIRAHNPELFDEKGRIIPINRLPERCVVVRHGKRYRRWVKTKNCLRLEARIRYLHRNLALQRRLAHQKLANVLLAFGNTFFIEKMNWQGLAKRCKEDKLNAKGKHTSKKRFGKSIASKAPATFTNILREKIETLGGTLLEINTSKAKASQYNHMDHTHKKKKLSQRWNHLPNGDAVQRDLYSAFLIQNANDTLDGFDQVLLDRKYSNFKPLHDDEIVRLSFLNTPSSTGVKRAG